MAAKKDAGQNNSWRQTEELEMDIQEWIQFLNSLYKKEIIKKNKTVFGELTLGQIIDLVKELTAEFNKYLKRDRTIERSKKKLLKETEKTINLWERGTDQ